MEFCTFFPNKEPEIRKICCENCGSAHCLTELTLPNYTHIVLCKNCMDKLTDFLKLNFGTKEE